jgi:sn-glycerol 3-phosphate transport system substrate-binding protein
MRPAHRRRTGARLGALATAIALLVAACGGSSSSNSSGGSSGGSGERSLPPCPVDALASATQPVEVVVWHSYGAKIKESLDQLAAAYNASQSKVRVRVENQGTSYREVWKKYQAAAKADQLPGIAILEDIATEAVADSGTVLPAQSCIDATKADTSDFVKPAMDAYTVDGALIPASLNLSSPLLYFNRNHLRRAGLDPDQPPTTLAEMRTAAEKIKAAGVVDKPIALILQPWFFETWLTGEKIPTVSNDNGRGTGATDQATFDNPQGLEVMTWIADMVKAGLLEPIPYTDGQVNQYLAMANQKASMTIETSTAATSVQAFLKGDTSVAGGQDTSAVDLNALDIGAAKMPGLRQPGKGQISGGAWYITNTTPPEVQAAAWDFMTWWNSLDTQVEWNLLGSYLPYRTSAAKDPRIVESWTTTPSGRWLAISYDQLQTGVDPAFPGPLVGPYDELREALTKAMEGVAFANEAPDATLRRASDTTTSALVAYNKET